MHSWGRMSMQWGLKSAFGAMWAEVCVYEGSDMQRLSPTVQPLSFAISL